MKCVLNVGGCNKSIPIPMHYDGWQHLLLDIDRNSDVDIVCDARKIPSTIPMHLGTFDAVYCSHNLEHFHRHEIPHVLAGFKALIKDDGFIEIRVPNLQSVFDHMAKPCASLGDVLYVSPAGPITALDIIFGMGRFIEQSGNDFMCHKTGFTAHSLAKTLFDNGLEILFVGAAQDLTAYAFKSNPTQAQIDLLHLSGASESKPNPAALAIKPTANLPASPDPALLDANQSQEVENV